MTPSVAAKYSPYQGGTTSYVLGANRAPRTTTELPIPPSQLWLGNGGTVDEYISGGRDHVDAMLEVLLDAGRPVRAGERILDFGCSTGRLIRHLVFAAETGEVWGVDIRAELVTWCQRQLSPPFRFVTTTTFPYLPFEDGFFDFVYAQGIFTDFIELVDLWLLELRRILAPDGRFYLTIHDRHSLELIMAFDEGHRLSWLKEAVTDFDRQSPFVGSSFDIVSINRLPMGAIVFYDLGYFTRKLETLGFRVLRVREEASWFLTAVLVMRV